MELKQIEALTRFKEALLHTQPESRIPRALVVERIQKTLCYEQRFNRLVGPHKRSGNTVLIKRGNF